MPSRCLVTSFDRKYYKYAAVMLQSLAQNYKKPLDVVCIVTPDLLEDDTLDRIKTRLVGADHLNIIFRASNNQEAKDAKPWFEITNYISGIIIDKVSIGEICHDYDEAVYVDGDCLFVRDATKFVNHPLHAGAKIIAMPEQSMVAERDLGKPEMAYFNNGVFVTDTATVEQMLRHWPSAQPNAVVFPKCDCGHSSKSFVVCGLKGCGPECPLTTKFGPG
jgi:lipopolysaccharide biosynthesis glycosyltransferase